jgi:hypothetical protein
MMSKRSIAASDSRALPGYFAFFRLLFALFTKTYSLLVKNQPFFRPK